MEEQEVVAEDAVFIECLLVNIITSSQVGPRTGLRGWVPLIHGLLLHLHGFVPQILGINTTLMARLVQKLGMVLRIMLALVDGMDIHKEAGALQFREKRKRQRYHNYKMQ